MKKKRRKFSIEEKQKAVEDYTSGRRTASEIADEFKVPTNIIYSWKTQLEDRRRDEREDQLEAEGHHPQDVRRIMQLEEEVKLYQQKLAETTIHVDLLKKLHPNYQQLKNANGLEEIKRILDQSKRRAK